MNRYNYQSFLIHVSLHYQNGHPSITFSENPNIPSDTIATITWAIDPHSAPFTFRRFRWCEHEKVDFHFSKMVQRRAMVVLIDNRSSEDAGTWAYQIRVESCAGDRIWSPACDNCANKCDKPYDQICLGSRPVIINDGGGGIPSMHDHS